MPEEGKNKYIAFIDALGISAKAHEDTREFHRALQNFYQNVTDCSTFLEESARVHHFSDCAYIESSSPKRIATYLREVRSRLLPLQVYIRGAVGRGKLSPKSRNATVIDNQGKVTGIYFGEDVVPLYRMEANLKGIGIQIHRNCIGDFEEYKMQSFFIPNENESIVECYWDLRLPEEDLKDSTFRQFLEDFLITNARSPYLGRYYISLIANWIRSLDLSDLSAEQLKLAVRKRDEDQIPLVIQRVLTGYFEKYFTGLIGLEYIYFTLIDKVLSDVHDPTVQEHFIRFLFAKKRVLNRIRFIPKDILEEKNRAEFLKQYSNYAAKK